MYSVNLLCKQNTTGTNNKNLKNIDFETKDKGIVCILGTKDSGTTSLLNILAGFTNYDSGIVSFNGKELSKLSESELLEYRRSSVSYIYSDYNIVESLTVEENLNLLIESYNLDSLGNKLKYLEYVGLKDLTNRKVKNLSDAHKQRLSIACSLMRNTDVIICDDPTRNLDRNSSYMIMGLLKDISNFKLVLFSTSNSDLATGFSDRIISLSDGYVEYDKKNDCSTISDKIREFHTLETKTDIAHILNMSDKNIERIEDGENKYNYSFKIAFDSVIIKKLFYALLLIIFTFTLTNILYYYSMSNYDYTSNYVKVVESMDYIAYNLEYNGNETYNSYYDFITKDNMFDEKDIVTRYSSDLSFDTVSTLYYTSYYLLHADYDYTNLGFKENPIVNDYDVIITSAIAHDIFGEESNINNYIGKTFQTDNLEYDLNVVAVIDTDYKNNKSVNSWINSDNYNNFRFDYDSATKHLGVFTSSKLYSEISKKGSIGYSIINDLNLTTNIEHAIKNNFTIFSGTADYGLEQLESVSVNGESMYNTDDVLRQCIIYITISVLAYFVYLNIVIKYKQKDFGVLREYDYSMAKIKKIMLLQSLFLIFSVFVISYVVSFCIMLISNYSYFGTASSNGASLNSFNLLLIPYTIIIYMVISALGYVFLLLRYHIVEPSIVKG